MNIDLDFRMCKYCGNRIESAYNYCAKKTNNGVYCSASCANAVHGFDNKIMGERRHKLVSFDPELHDSPCETESQKSAQSAFDMTETEIMEKAKAIDPRLREILLCMKDGDSQKTIARHLKMTQQNVNYLLRKMRVSLSS